MATIGNIPQERLVLRAAARKSWALGLYLKTDEDHTIDVTDAVFSLVVSRVNPAEDELPVIDMLAVPIAPEVGHVRFHLQATDTDLDAEEYNSTITMRSGGYSVVLAQGPFEITENTETESTLFDYDEVMDAGLLEVWLHRRNVIKIVAPTVMTKGNKGDKGDQGDQGDQGDPGVGLAPGGAVGSIPVKTALADYVTGWGAPEALLPVPGSTVNTYTVGDYTVFEFVPIDDIGLKATGTTEGMVPRALPGELWGWELLKASDIQDTDDLVIMTAEERTKLEGISGSSLASSDWEAEVDEDGYIFNKPELGTAALENVEAFRPSDWVPTLFELSDVDGGDYLPETGPPGTFWILLPTPEP